MGAWRAGWPRSPSSIACASTRIGRILAAERDALAELDQQRDGGRGAAEGCGARARRRRRRGRRAQPADRRSRSAPRSGRAVRRRAAGRAARARAHGGDRRRRVDRGRAADSPVPRRPAVADHRRGQRRASARQPSGRFGTPIVRNGIEVAAAEGTPATAVHEGTVAYAAPFTRFRHAGDRRSRRSAFTLVWPSFGGVVTAGTNVSRGTALGTRRPVAVRRSRPVFRGAHRRPPGRSRYNGLRSIESDEDSRAGLVLAVSMPVIAFAVIGGFMSKAIAREDSYQYLRIFEDVVVADHEQLRRRSERRQGDARRDARPRRRPRSRQRLSSTSTRSRCSTRATSAARRRPASS